MAIASKASLAFGFPDQESRIAAQSAISHENEAGGRSRTAVSGEGRTLRIEIDADDPIALRSSVNAYLRAIGAFSGLEEKRL